MPMHARTGAEAEIPAELLTLTRTVLREEAHQFDWQLGDVLLLDNMLTAHGRLAFHGERTILVAMGGPVAVADVFRQRRPPSKRRLCLSGILIEKGTHGCRRLVRERRHLQLHRQITQPPMRPHQQHDVRTVLRREHRIRHVLPTPSQPRCGSSAAHPAQGATAPQT